MTQPTKELTVLQKLEIELSAVEKLYPMTGGYLTNLLSRAISEAREAERNMILQMITPTIKEASQHDSIQESESASVRYGVFKGLALLQRKIMESPNKKETKKEL